MASETETALPTGVEISFVGLLKPLQPFREISIVKPLRLVNNPLHTPQHQSHHPMSIVRTSSPSMLPTARLEY